MNETRKLIRQSTDEKISKESFANELESAIAEKMVNCGLTNFAMFYHCEDCGKTILIWLERGLEEHNGKYHKPVPFAVTCPFCKHFHMEHVMWDADIHLNKTIPIPNDSYYFANLHDRDCGTLRRKGD